MVSQQHCSTCPKTASRQVRRIAKALKRGHNVLIELSYRLKGRIKSLKLWIESTIEDVWGHLASALSGHSIHKIKFLRAEHVAVIA